MEFSVQLSCDYPDSAYGGGRLYKDILEQAMLADRLGFESVAITEHHLINLLMMPAPLQFAVKIAAMTKQVKIITAVVVLPLHDMRVFAGDKQHVLNQVDAFHRGGAELGETAGCNPLLNRFMANELADSELITLDGLKHSILIEGPERVSPQVKDFLLRHNKR